MGNQQKSVTVTTNDPVQETVKLNVKGEVHVLLRISTTFLDFKDILSGGPKPKPISLTPAKGVEFEILEVESPGPEFEIEIVSEYDILRTLENLLKSAGQRMVKKFGPRHPVASPHTGTGKRAEPDAHVPGTRTINVRVSPTAPRGRHSGTLKIHTNLAEKPLLVVRVAANVAGNVVVEPKYRHIGSVKQGKTKHATFRIMTRREASVKITGVETDSEYTSAQLSQLVPGSEYELKISVLPTARLGMLHGTATVYTTDKEQPEIELRYNARVTK